jgi:hypothetical protein
MLIARLPPTEARFEKCGLARHAIDDDEPRATFGSDQLRKTPPMLLAHELLTFTKRYIIYHIIDALKFVMTSFARRPALAGRNWQAASRFPSGRQTAEASPPHAKRIARRDAIKDLRTRESRAKEVLTR